MKNWNLFSNNAIILKTRLLWKLKINKLQFKSIVLFKINLKFIPKLFNPLKNK